MDLADFEQFPYMEAMTLPYVDIEVLKRWLCNLKDSWLLIFDNADDPSLNISQYFPTGDRGTMLITTRNPDCQVHATVGSREFREMKPDEAITLLLRTAGNDASKTSLRALAKPIVEILGYLALAIVQAGAIIRQKFCNMQEFCKIYAAHRQQLLSRQPIQVDSDYRYTVYTTWEISIGMIEKMPSEVASNALALLRLFSFLHFDGISEEILENAWKNMHATQLSDWSRSYQLRMLYEMTSESWDPRSTREALVLLSSFSLISIDEVNHQFSMHPLVHAWAGDRMSRIEQTHCWTLTASTLAISVSWQWQNSDYRFRSLLLPHLLFLLGSCSNTLFADHANLEMVSIALKFGLVLEENGRYQDALKLEEKIVEVTKRILAKDHPNYLDAFDRLGMSGSLHDMEVERLKGLIELKVKSRL